MLFEGGDRILSAYPPKLSAAAKHSLEQRQVDVRLNCRVVGIDNAGVTVESDGTLSRVDARTTLWAAGVQASPLGKVLGVRTDRAGRVLVEPDLSIPGHPEVFVLGDLALVWNRFFVMLSWSWSWISFKRGARLITGTCRDCHPSARSTRTASRSCCVVRPRSRSHTRGLA